MWLDVESDNLVKVPSSSTLQVLSHAIMHCDKEAKVCLSSPGTQQSHIFPSGGSLLLTSWLLLRQDDSFFREEKCVNGVAAFRGACISSS